MDRGCKRLEDSELDFKHPNEQVYPARDDVGVLLLLRMLSGIAVSYP